MLFRSVNYENEEMQEAVRRGLKIYRRAEMLAYLMSTKAGIGVAGTHGKTTTSAMISTMLEFAGYDPTVVIGGMLPAIGGGNAKAGMGEHLVAEADESDGTFLLLLPKIAVVTNIEADHLDYYNDFNHIRDAFELYLKQLPKNGFATLCFDCETVCELAKNSSADVVSYGLEPGADYSVKNIIHKPISEGGGACADVYFHGGFLGRLELRVSGRHNVCNAMGAIAVGRKLGLSFEECIHGLSFFTGTGRRFEELGKFDILRVVDDYAHHPTEVAATISAAREQGAKKIMAVFQPHRYTRTQSMYQDFAVALKSADRILLCEIYPAFEKPIKDVSAMMIVDELRGLGHEQADYVPDLQSGLEYLQNQLQDEDLLLIMGAGNVRTLGENFVRSITEESKCKIVMA